MKFNLSQPQRIKAAFVATVLGAAAIEGTVLAHQHHVHTGKDAFLHYQVDSTDELITALKNNPTLRRNYAHHFGIAEDQIVDFVKRTLVPYHLPTGRTVTTYGVTKTGHIYPVHTFLKKGTLVWATRSGLPVLKWACANPLTKNLPGTLLASQPKPTQGHQMTHRAPMIASIPSNEMTETPVTPAATNVAVPILSAPLASTTSALTLPPALVGSGSATTPLIASIPVSIGGGHGGSGFPLIPILIGLGAAVSHSGGNSGGNSSAPPVVTNIPTATPVVETPGTTPSGPVAIVTTPTPAPVAVITTPEAIPTPVPTIPSFVPTPAPFVPTATPAPSTPGTPAPTTPGVPGPGGSPNAVPEPGSLALLALTGLPVIGGLIARRRRTE
jgi:hypothetical protein